jgi:hypothetical protein
VSAQTLGFGKSYQSANPTYEMSGSIRPRYYFYDDGTSCRLGVNGFGGVLHALSKASLDDFVAALAEIPVAERMFRANDLSPR